MDEGERQQHWERVYREREPTSVSWFEDVPTVSLKLIARSGVQSSECVVDIGGGASCLVDHLLDRGFEDLLVVDVSAAALKHAQVRLGPRSERVTWCASDVLDLELPEESIALWHDRATFHFLTAAEDQQRYVRTVERSVQPAGHVVIGTFADDGPQTCSGLEVTRYAPQTLAALFARQFELVRSCRSEHVTPQGRSQRFGFVLLRKRGAPEVVTEAR